MKALSIKLSRKVLGHIVSRHPEVARYTHEIVVAVQDPDLIVRGLRGEFKALKFHANLHIGPKYLVVIYQEKGYYNRLLHF
jgi:ABC-type Fe2+-enterobactin transport system substrate-binding protein